MVLTNLHVVGIGLLLLCIPSSISEQQESLSRRQETTTISAKTTKLQSHISAITSKPKTDVTNNKFLEQKKNRGSTRFANFGPSTEKTTERNTVPQQNVEQKSNKLTTVRNDRSLDNNEDIYKSSRFNIENNIYSQSQKVEKKHESIDKDKFATEKWWDHVLTTPKNDFFDTKFLKVQDDITKSFDEGHTTPKEEIFFSKSHEMQADISKFMERDLTTPKHEVFDDSFKKMHDDISRSIDENMDKHFDEESRNSAEIAEEPLVKDSQMDYTSYRSIEAVESKIKNKVHKNYNTEEGMRMKEISSYNNTQVIDAPGIVINTIPGKDENTRKKIDLDHGETIIERVTIEKPAKEPGPFISNKIENESPIAPVTEQSRENPDEKPFEHKSLYLSKRGSTTQNERTIEKTLSTEPGIPLDLYPSKYSTSQLTSSDAFLKNDSTTTPSKSIKKDKISKNIKKESDLDNKIPKFLPGISLDLPRINLTTSAPLLNNSSTNAPSSDNFYEVDRDSTYPLSYTVPTEDLNFTEETNSTNNDNDKIESTSDKFFEATESIMVETTFTENISTAYDEITTEIPLNLTTTKPKEITTESDIEATVTPPSEGYTNLNGKDNETETEKQTNQDSYTTALPLIQTSVTESTNVEKIEKTTIDFETTSYKNVINPNKYNDTTTNVNIVIIKKNETFSSEINEITKTTPNMTSTMSSALNTKSSITQLATATEKMETNNSSEADQTSQNEINTNKPPADHCEGGDNSEDYDENNCKSHGTEETHVTEIDSEDITVNTEENKKSVVTPRMQILSTRKSSVIEESVPTTIVPIIIPTIEAVTPPQDDVIETSDDDFDTTARTDSIIGSEESNEEEGGNGGKIAAIVISTIGGICLLLLVTLLIIMKKRQKRFNYGQRCRPVSLDAYSVDNVSIHNSTRRKGVLMASKRSYGNPAFDDPTSPNNLLNISELLKFGNNHEGIKAEFEKIPQVTTKTNELPDGCDVKNRYANVIPLPETRVFLNLIEGVPSSDYINANYVTGPQGSRQYYIACQGPMQNTVEDFWRMIWEQQSKVILMLTHLYESGVEKCVDYLPPSEVLDCHRLFGDYQITLKKREVKDKYIISSLQLKNMVSNSWREVAHLWYMGWPEKGTPDEANSLITFLIEARSCMKTSDTKIKETNNVNISNGLSHSLSPVVVHCSPGTGRTGTVIACDIAIREFELTRKVDIPKIVHRIRRDRASAVQTKEQYEYIYKVITFYAAKLTGGAFDSF